MPEAASSPTPKKKSGVGAKKKAPTAEVGRITPPPPPVLHVTPIAIAVGTELHRVHSDAYGGAEFNPGLKGNARFSPIQNAKGDAIPTIYAAGTLEGALMESVFHDVPHAAGFKQLDKRKLEGQEHSTLKIKQTLTLADLSSKPLRKLGVSRKQLIDTEKDQYPQTREWAAAIHSAHPDIQGLCWVSRQDDTVRALMLFGERVPRGALEQVGNSCNVLTDDQTYAQVLELAEVIGVSVVAGKGK